MKCIICDATFEHSEPLLRFQCQNCNTIYLKRSQTKLGVPESFGLKAVTIYGEQYYPLKDQSIIPKISSGKFDGSDKPNLFVGIISSLGALLSMFTFFD